MNNFFLKKAEKFRFSVSYHKQCQTESDIFSAYFYDIYTNCLPKLLLKPLQTGLNGYLYYALKEESKSEYSNPINLENGRR